MTTSLRAIQAPSLFVDNPIVRLDHDGPLILADLSAVAWLAKGIDPKSAHEEALYTIIRQARMEFPEFDHWLLACHSTWQPDNRITRHKKFWNSLKEAHGVTIPMGNRCAEGLVERDGCLRFFAGLRLEPSHEAAAAALSVVHEEHASTIIILPPRPAEVIDGLVTSGWPVPEFQRPSKEVLAVITKHDGIVLHPLGVFDDFEAGVVAIAKPAIIKRLLGNGHILLTDQ